MSVTIGWLIQYEWGAMDIQLWLAFAAASLVIAVIPGPGVVSIVGFAMSSGRRVALTSVVGMAIGNAIAVSLSLAGAAAILASSALAFAALKWVGAAYLITIGLIAIVRSAKPDTSVNETSGVSSRTALLTNVVVGTLHPKTILFFVAFSAEFIRPDLPYLAQATALVLTFTLIALVTDTFYALSASQAAELLRSNRAKRWSRRAGGGVLVAAGLAMVALRR
jgi:threonine/homoserine/homoserine lactone efflux protein